jgi:hypothetical protein
MMNILRLNLTYVLAFILPRFYFAFNGRYFNYFSFLLAFVVFQQIFIVYRSNNEKSIEKY